MPKITHNTPLLIPGKIAPAPIATPLKKSLSTQCAFDSA